MEHKLINDFTWSFAPFLFALKVLTLTAKKEIQPQVSTKYRQIFANEHRIAWFKWALIKVDRSLNYERNFGMIVADINDIVV